MYLNLDLTSKLCLQNQKPAVENCQDIRFTRFVDMELQLKTVVKNQKLERFCWRLDDFKPVSVSF